jgi:hypothetical protein
LWVKWKKRFPGMASLGDHIHSRFAADKRRNYISRLSRGGEGGSQHPFKDKAFSAF